MVEAIPTNQVSGDGVRRPFRYATWREDKKADPGHSRELISVRVEPQYYDDLAGQPLMQGDSITTVMEAFKRQVETRGDADFLGVR